MNLRPIGRLFVESFKGWQSHNAARVAAALTYYTLFSMAPLLIVAVAIAGVVLGTQAAQAELSAQIQQYIGEGAAKFILGLLEGAAKPSSGIIATVISIITILLGATGLFGELQGGLNTIWDVPVPASKGLLAGIIDLLKHRLIDFLLVLGVGVLLLASAVITTLLSTFINAVSSESSPLRYNMIQILSFVVAFAIATVGFAIVYRVLPDTFVSWRDVWIGAAVTSILFNVGRLLIGIYLSIGSATSAYGAAGSLVALLLWINYSAQIFLFGAEFTHVYANQQGSRTPQGAIETREEKEQAEKTN
jgi:membrane protein